MLDPTLRKRFLGALALYFVFHTALRFLWPDVLESDEADQLLVAQWFQWGYSAQPPLYAWLQTALLRIVGHDLLALALFRNLLLFWTYAAVFLVAERMLDTSRATLASAGMLLIPQIVWESQRSLTHTLLVVAMAATTLLWFLRLVRQKTLGRYLVLGLLIGLGTLSKHNFLFFWAALFAAAALVREGRRVLGDRRLLLALAVAVCVVLPYGLWVLDHQAQAMRSTSKFRIAGGSGAWRGIAPLAMAVATFAGPFLLVAAALFPATLRRLWKPGARFEERLLQRYLLVVLTLVLVAVLVFRPTSIRDRWLQPLLFLFPLRFFASAGEVSRKAARRFLAVCTTAALLVTAGLALRAREAPRVGSFSRLNYPFPALVREIRKEGFAGGVIVASGGFLAGNLLRQFPGSHATAPDFVLGRLPGLAARRDVLVIWERADGSRVAGLRRFLQRKFGIEMAASRVREFELPLRHGARPSQFRFFVVERGGS